MTVVTGVGDDRLSEATSDEIEQAMHNLEAGFEVKTGLPEADR